MVVETRSQLRVKETEREKQTRVPVTHVGKGSMEFSGQRVGCMRGGASSS